MRALILDIRDPHATDPLLARYPAARLPLVDRPWIQHLVESLVDRGVTRFDLLAGQDTTPIEQTLADGRRWGCRIAYHRLDDPSRPYDQFLEVTAGDAGPFVVAHADRLAAVPLDDALHLAADGSPVAFQPAGGADAEEFYSDESWSGWAVLTREWLDASPAGATEADYGDYLLAICRQRGTRVEVPALLSNRSAVELLAAQQAVLRADVVATRLYGREQTPGVRICRGARIHRTAQIVAPAFVGDNAWIGPHVTLGPGAIIGLSAIVDRRTLVKNTLVLPGTYVGEGLDLVDCLIDPHHLTNTRHAATIPIPDPLISDASR